MLVGVFSKCPMVVIGLLRKLVQVHLLRDVLMKVRIVFASGDDDFVVVVLKVMVWEEEEQRRGCSVNQCLERSLGNECFSIFVDVEVETSQYHGKYRMRNVLGCTLRSEGWKRVRIGEVGDVLDGGYSASRQSE